MLEKIICNRFLIDSFDVNSKNISLTKISKIKNYLNFKIESNFYIASIKLYIY